MTKLCPAIFGLFTLEGSTSLFADRPSDLGHMGAPLAALRHHRNGVRSQPFFLPTETFLQLGVRLRPRCGTAARASAAAQGHACWSSRPARTCCASTAPACPGAAPPLRLSWKPPIECA